jgi:CRP-like cAMP-binding protein
VKAAVARIPKRYGAAVRVAKPDPEELIGEMSLMTNSRRNATLVAVAPGPVIEIDRNVLHLLMQDRAVRAKLDAKYAQRAIIEFLPKMVAGSRLFNRVSADTGDDAWEGRFTAYLLRAVPAKQGGDGTSTMMEINLAAAQALGESGATIQTTAPVKPDGNVTLVRLTPGQVVCEAGGRADNFYLIRGGFIGLEVPTPAGPKTLKPLTAGDCFGEVALLLGGTRTATCTALDHAELLVVPEKVFDGFLDRPENARVKAAMKARAKALAGGAGK